MENKPRTFEDRVQTLADFMTNSRNGAQAAQALAFFLLGAAAFGAWSHFQPQRDKALRDTVASNTELVAIMTKRDHARWVLDNRANVLLAIEQAHYAANALQTDYFPPHKNGMMVKLSHPAPKVRGDAVHPPRLANLVLQRRPGKTWIKTKDLSDLAKTVRRSLDAKQEQLTKLQSAVVAQLRRKLHDDPDQELQVDQLEENLQTVQDNLSDSKQRAEQSIQAAQRDVATAEQAVNIVSPEGPAILTEAATVRPAAKPSVKKRTAVVHNPKPVSPRSP